MMRYVALALLVFLGACDDSPLEIVCPNGWRDPGVRVEVRRSDGMPLAIGSKLSAMSQGLPVLSGSASRTIDGIDSLNIVALNEPGLYHLQVWRPGYQSYYTDARVHSDGPCYVRTTVVKAVLQAEDPSLLVQSVTILPSDAWRPSQERQSFQLLVFVDAKPGVSPAVTWRSTNPAIVPIDVNGRIPASACTKGDGTVILEAIANADTTKRSRVSFWECY
jgi:hypothetical protein